MQPIDWFTITRNRLGASEFFLRSPFRYAYFQLVLISLALDLLCLGIVVGHYWNRLSILVVVALALGVWAMISVCLLTVRAHQAVNSLFRTGQIDRLEPGSNLEKALSLFAILSNQALLYVSLGALAYFGALFGVLYNH